MFRNHFADKRSLFDDERLIELAVEAGLDKHEAAAVLADENAYAAEVRADEREAAMLGTTSSRSSRTLFVPSIAADCRLSPPTTVSGG